MRMMWGSSCFPMGVASPFFRSLPLEEFGLRWIQPSAPLAHPLDDGTAVMLEQDVDARAAQFGQHDARAWRSLMGPSVRDWKQLVDAVTAPWMGLPQRLDTMAGFGSVALFPARGLTRAVFQDERARALFAGVAAHAVIPLTHIASAATGLVLTTGCVAYDGMACSGGWSAVDHARAGGISAVAGRKDRDGV